MRRALRLEATQTLNPLLTATKMRDLTSSYKRHTIRRPIRPEGGLGSQLTLRSRVRTSASDFFYIYCAQIIPQIEDSVENMLLEKFKSTLSSKLERNEVEQAYLQRKDNVAKIPEREDPGLPPPPEKKVALHKQEFANVVQSIHGDGLSQHTFEDIGRFTVFPKAMTERMFPSIMFGRYKEEEYDRNAGTFGVQTREEGLRITNDLARLTLPHERKIDYEQIAAMSNSLVKEEILQDEEHYVALFQDMSLSLLDYIDQQEPYEAHMAYKEFFSSPGVFDGVVNLLVQELRKSPIRPHLCDKKQRTHVIDQIVHALMDICDEKKLVVHDFAEIMEHLGMLKLTLKKADLEEPYHALQKQDEITYKLYLRGYHKKCHHHWRPEDIRRVGLGTGAFKGFNTGGLLWGESGSGKSQILAYLAAWAHENSWINITIPSCAEFTDNTFLVERMENGLYLQFELAQRLLNDLRTQNEQIFSEMDVDLERYGKRDMTGVKDGDPEPCPRTWDPLRQCWSDDWKGYLYDVELKYLEQRYKDLDYRLADKCPKPSKMIEFIDVALEDGNLATNAIAEILDQVYAQDKHQVLVLLDGYNTWLQPTQYPSFRYTNDPSLKGLIPPKDVALIRLLLKFDGHFLRQGVKYMTTTHRKTFNHIMTPEMVDWFDGYHHRVPNLTLDEFRNCIFFKSITGWAPRIYHEWEIEQFYMASQGNYGAFHA